MAFDQASLRGNPSHDIVINIPESTGRNEQSHIVLRGWQFIISYPLIFYGKYNKLYAMYSLPCLLTLKRVRECQTLIFGRIASVKLVP
jgi:hypothetical protein